MIVSDLCIYVWKINNKIYKNIKVDPSAIKHLFQRNKECCQMRY